MAYAITAIDRVTLPTDLLLVAKQQMRVEFDRDDEFIKLCLARAIDQVERFTGARIFKTEMDWWPELTGMWAYETPAQPVTEFEVMLGAEDISDNFHLRLGSPVDPVFLIHSDETAFPVDCEIVLVLGFASGDTVPPMYLDPILRIAAHLYEHRESIDATNLMAIPQWANDLLSGTWIPRC